MQFLAKAPKLKLAILILAFGALALYIWRRSPVVSYYAPVVRKDKKEVAYLKRIVRLSYGRQGFGGRPTREFSMDRLEVCTAKIDLSRERCLESWDLPLEKATPYSDGIIYAECTWKDSELLFRITLEDFVWECEDVSCPKDDSGRPYASDRILSNVGEGALLDTAERDAAISSEVDPDPNVWGPVPNAIILRGEGIHVGERSGW